MKAILTLLLVSSSAFAEIHHAQGEMAGEVTATSVLLQTRLTAAATLDESGDVPGKEGVACFEWSESADFARVTSTKWSTAIRNANLPQVE